MHEKLFIPFCVSLAFLVVACSEEPQDRKENKIDPPATEESSSEEQDNRPINIGYDNSKKYADGISVINDTQGCQYILFSFYKRGASLTPRLNKQGKPVCDESDRK